jgi:hypothetical protein
MLGSEQEKAKLRARVDALNVTKVQIDFANKCGITAGKHLEVNQTLNARSVVSTHT